MQTNTKGSFPSKHLRTGSHHNLCKQHKLYNRTTLTHFSRPTTRRYETKTRFQHHRKHTMQTNHTSISHFQLRSKQGNTQLLLQRSFPTTRKKGPTKGPKTLPKRPNPISRPHHLRHVRHTNKHHLHHKTHHRPIPRSKLRHFNVNLSSLQLLFSNSRSSRPNCRKGNLSSFFHHPSRRNRKRSKHGTPNSLYKFRTNLSTPTPRKDTSKSKLFPWPPSNKFPTFPHSIRRRHLQDHRQLPYRAIPTSNTISRGKTKETTHL